MVFGLFKKKKKNNDKYLSLTVREIIKETHDTVTIIFDHPEIPLEYRPGQFLTLIFNIEGKEERRSYSLCTSPFTDENPAVTIKRVSDGKVSNFINDSLKPGDTVRIMPAMGAFTTDPINTNKRNVVVFGAGSGITPLMSIIKSVLHIEGNSKVTLIYGNRDEQSIIFKNLLTDLKDKYKDKLNIIHVLSQPGADWKGVSGRLTKDVVKEILLDLPEFKVSDAEYFLCGPSGFMHTVENSLEELNVPKSKVFKESFVSSGTEKDAESGQSEITEQNVKIVLDGEEHDVKVIPKKTILEAGLDDNIDMPFSCQSGLCTACRGKLLSGKVHMEENDGLTDEELENGYVLCCVSHPLTDDVKIEIG